MIARYLTLSKKIANISVTRALQLEELQKREFNGRLLDFGGGEKAQYRDDISTSQYNSINIDPNIDPTWVVGIGEKVPCKKDSFDLVLSLNTLEHILDAKMVINDLYGVLKKDGEIVISTPFMFPIHGHPDDYFRPTPSWYKEILSTAGFREIEITSLWLGPFTTGSLCSGQPGPAKLFRMRCAIFGDLFYHYLRRLAGKRDLTASSLSPLALWVVARK
jgi:SAM-dependent methyltransferase